MRDTYYISTAFIEDSHSAVKLRYGERHGGLAAPKQQNDARSALLGVASRNMHQSVFPSPVSSTLSEAKAGRSKDFKK